MTWGCRRSQLHAQRAVLSINGLSSINGLLSSINGSSSINRPSTASITIGRPHGSPGQVRPRCQRQGQGRTRTDNYTFAGGIGLCPAWRTGASPTACLSHGGDRPRRPRSPAGVHVPLWLDLALLSAGASTEPTSHAGGCLIFDTGAMTNLSKPSVTAHFCWTRRVPSGASGVVAGRRASQSGAPHEPIRQRQPPPDWRSE